MRYKTDLYRPGSDTPGKQIVGFNQAVQDDWNMLQARMSELSAQLSAIKNEQELVKTNLAFLVVERCDIKDDCERLAALRLEAEAIQLGIDALRDRAALLKRGNSWLTHR